MTTKPTPIRTNLFRFVTSRTPQLITEQKKKLGFIYHPNASSSHFFIGLKTDDINQAREHVRSVHKQFSPIDSLDSVKKIAPKLYRFAAWLAKNKTKLTETETLHQASSIDILSEEKRIIVWDNLFYQILAKSNPLIRQACIQLIIADNFLQTIAQSDIRDMAKKAMQTPRLPEPPEESERFTLLLQRLAKAKVVVPKCFSTKRKKSRGHTKGDKHVGLLTDAEISPNEIKLRKDHLNVARKISIEKLGAVRTELRNSSKISSFNSSSLKLLSLDGLEKRKLSLNKVKELENKITHEINTEVKRYNKSIKRASALYKFKSKTDYPTNVAYPFVISISNNTMLMSLKLGYLNGYIKSAAYKTSLDGELVEEENKVKIIDTNISEGVTIELFPNSDIDFSKHDFFELEGQFKLNNGETITFLIDSPIATETVHSRAKATSDKTEDDIYEEEATEEATDTYDSDSETSTDPDDAYATGELFGVYNLGVGVFRRVEQEVCCYVPGEVSRIENILAREYKERHTRSLLSSETTEEETTDLEIETQSDTVSTTRNELQTEVVKELEKNTSLEAGASLGVTGKFGWGEVKAEGSFGFASSNASSSSDTEAKNYAQEITESALERILQKTSLKRTSRILQEYEENNRHGFDNREGTEHVTGVYRWVDIIYKNRLINYGKMLMMEFHVPEPAKFYKLALEAKAEQTASSQSSASLETDPPEPPSSYGINESADITEGNYLDLGRTYDITLEDPVSPNPDYITKTFGPSDDPDGDTKSSASPKEFQFTMNFMEAMGSEDYTSYKASKVVVSFNFDYHINRSGTEHGTYFILKVGSNTLKIDKNWSETDTEDEETGETIPGFPNSPGTTKKKSSNFNHTVEYNLSGGNELKVTVDHKNVYGFSVTLDVQMDVEASVLSSWKSKVYDEIMRAYEDALDAYETEVAEQEEALEEALSEETSSSSTSNRTIEKRELQRAAIEMLTKPFGIEMGGDFYYDGDCDIPQIEQTSEWEEYASHVKFFEQAFHWDQIAYLFYPYYWADKCSWIDLLQQEDGDDATFQAFLQSGMARLVVPVRNEFREAITYYMDTGDIWNGGGLVMDTSDDLYLSIDEEMEEIEGTVEKEWETRVPTTLTIVQGNSVYLEDEGLPCCEMIEGSDVDTLLRASTTILGTSTSEDPE